MELVRWVAEVGVGFETHTAPWPHETIMVHTGLKFVGHVAVTWHFAEPDHFECVPTHCHATEQHCQRSCEQWHAIKTASFLFDIWSAYEVRTKVVSRRSYATDEPVHEITFEHDQTKLRLVSLNRTVYGVALLVIN